MQEVHAEPRRKRFGPIDAAIVLALVALVAYNLFTISGGTKTKTGLEDARVGKVAPDFELSTLDPGPPVRLSALAGKVVLVDFWATTCGPCIRMMPELEGLKQRLAGAPFELLSVNVDLANDRREQLVRDFLRQHGLTTTRPLLDDGRAAVAWDVHRIPLLALVGPDGTIRRVYRGFTEIAPIEKAIADTLATAPKPADTTPTAPAAAPNPAEAVPSAPAAAPNPAEAVPSAPAPNPQ